MIMKLNITIITGFLGAGKSSFLMRILQLPQFANASVIINEMGAESLDHLLVETLNEDVYPIQAGCICCSSHSQMNELLLNKLMKTKHKGSDKIFIETSGVTDAVALLSQMNAEPGLAGKFIAQTLCLVSALDFNESHLASPEFSNQIASADQVLLSKADLISEHERDKRLAHVASAISAQFSHVSIAPVPTVSSKMKRMLEQPKTAATFNDSPAPSTHKSHGFDFRTLSLERAVTDGELLRFLEMLQFKFGQVIFRIKGLAMNSQDPLRPRVIQLVGQSEAHLGWLDNWPDVPRTAITVIFREDINAATHNVGTQIVQLFRSWFNLVETDGADRAALNDSPLSVTGLGAFNPRSFHQSEPD